MPDVPIAVRERLAAAAELDDGIDAIKALLDIQLAEWPVAATHGDTILAAGLVLATMRAIERAFSRVHPRSRTLSPAVASVRPPPTWLRAAERRRLRQGSFAESDDARAIPAGPFVRHARGRDASAADSLRDQSPFLSVAPRTSRQEDRSIRVEMKVIGTDIMRGVPASSSIGTERIRFIPLAEDRDDLRFEHGMRNGHSVLDVRPSIDTAGRLVAALADGDDVDIAFSPELTLPGDREDDVAVGIALLAEHAPRIILAGSGLSVDTGQCRRSWNEARVLARGGHLLWRHRKIWPFGMQRDTAVGYGFPDPGAERTLMEDIANDDLITVVDMDGFGRCIILICQDFQSQPVVDEVISRYQPDWVFTPVLDPGVNVPGWAHQRAEALSRHSQARLLVGSSLSMSGLGGHAAKPEPPIGLAVGPFTNADPSGPGRALALVRAGAGPSPRSGVLVWIMIPPSGRGPTSAHPESTSRSTVRRDRAALRFAKDKAMKVMAVSCSPETGDWVAL